jgi:16S rRNA (uracil1498-N3)-methyltransferase
MSLPFFFVDDLNDKTIVLDEDTSKHIVNVLRMQKGEEISLTDGKGKKANAVIIDDNRKKCSVKISSIQNEDKRNTKIVIGISLIKNTSRFEWFLEKATEIGINEIIPLVCSRTEKEKFRSDRLQNIVISAMLQSQQSWLPVLHQPTDFARAVQLLFEQKFIAHCGQTNKQALSSQQLNPSASQLILIGPEGDFTQEEIELSLKNHFIPVSLGNTRLRTETAGIVAATLLQLNRALLL